MCVGACVGALRSVAYWWIVIVVAFVSYLITLGEVITQKLSAVDVGPLLGRLSVHGMAGWRCSAQGRG